MSERIEEIVCCSCELCKDCVQHKTLVGELLEQVEHLKRRNEKNKEYFGEKLEAERYRADNAEEECRRLNYDLGKCLSCDGCGFHNNPDPEEERRIPRIPCHGCGGTGRRYPLKETPKVFKETQETEQDLHYPKHERSD
jgi:hypothetical protein